jgi:hypothetical protein
MWVVANLIERYFFPGDGQLAFGERAMLSTMASEEKPTGAKLTTTIIRAGLRSSKRVERIEERCV